MNEISEIIRRSVRRIMRRSLSEKSSRWWRQLSEDDPSGHRERIGKMRRPLGTDLRQDINEELSRGDETEREEAEENDHH